MFFTIRFFINKNKNIRVDQSFSYSSLSMKFNTSYLSTLDYGGKQIKNNKTYLAVKITVTNKTNGMHTIQTGDFCLDIDNNCIYPNLDKSGLFIDLAKPYYASQIGAGTTNEYVIVYELDDSQVKSNYKIKVLDSITYKDDNAIAKYKEINLTPEYSNKVNEVGKYKLSENINLNKTPLYNTNLTVDEYNISSYYRYTYDYCVNNECRESLNSIPASVSKEFLILKGKLELDGESSYAKNKLGSNDFFQDFVTIDYYINDKKNSVNVKNVTPKEEDNYIVLEVNSNIKYADKIDLTIEKL